MKSGEPIAEISSSDRPVLVQGSAAPAFVGGGIDKFQCQYCGHVLAENYNPRSLIAVDIECFICHKVSRTQQWPDGESLPKPVIAMGTSGRFLLESPVPMFSGPAISCEAEIERVRTLTAFKPGLPNKLELTLEGLQRLEAEFNLLTVNEFAKWIAATKRAMAAGNLTFTKCPPAWAVEHMRARLSQEWTELSPSDVMAIGYLHQVRHLIDRWHRHHLFPMVARSFCSEFHHAITMLTAAAYLHDAGNNIGFTDTVAAAGRSPDLYINTSTDNRISIEVKAPDHFFWPSAELGINDLEKHIHRALKSARDQLTGKDGGIVVVGAGYPDDYQAIFAKAIENVAASGKISSRIAAIAGVYHLSMCRSHSPGSLNWRVSSNVSVSLNPRFLGANPVNPGK